MALDTPRQAGEREGSHAPDDYAEAAIASAPPESLQNWVQRCREAGRFGPALDLARERLQRLRSDPATPPYEARDAAIQVETLERAAALPVSDQRDLARADRLDGRMAALFGQGEYVAAQEVVREQLAIRRRLLGDRHGDLGISLNNLATILYAMGSYAEAESECREALFIFRELYGEDSPSVAITLSSLGMMLKDQGRFTQADSVLRHALAISHRIHPAPHDDTVLILGNLASVVQAAGDFRTAEALYREVLLLQRELTHSEDPALAVNLNNLALVLRLQGDYAGAEPLQRLALDLQRRALGPDHPDAATSLHNLAYLREAQGDLAAAEQLYREALAALSKSLGAEHPRIARTLTNLGLVLQEQGENAPADSAMRAAAGMYERLFGPEHPLVASSMQKRAELLALRGDILAAEALYEHVIRLQEKLLGTAHPEYAATLTGLAKLRERAGMAAAAEDLQRRALEIRRGALGETHPAVVENLTAIGRLRRGQGDPAAAEAILREAAAAYELARSHSGGGLEGSTFVESPYPLLAAVRLELGRTLQAWEAVERAQGRALYELLRSARQGITPGDSAPALTWEQGWSVLREGASLPPPEGPAFTLARIQASLEPATVVIGWLDVTPDREGRGSYIYVVRSSGPVLWSPCGGRGGSGSRSGGDSEHGSGSPGGSDSEERSGFALQGLARGDAFRDARGRAYRNDIVAAGSSPLGAPARPEFLGQAQALWFERFAPVMGFLKHVESLVVIPSGPMLGVPVEAIADSSGQWLGDSYAISYTPSATLYTHFHERPRSAARRPERALLVGDPAPPNDPSDPLAGLPRLVWSQHEVEALSALLPGSLRLTGAQATEQALADLAASGGLGAFHIIHLAVHGLVDDRRPERSALVLSRQGFAAAGHEALRGRRVADGLLSTVEIVRQWKLDADMVTLSACESALGREVVGEGYIGLADAFLQAGSRSVLVSLWSVDDRATALFMHHFYSNWLGRAGGDAAAPAAGRAPAMSKAQALREARRWMRERRDGSGRAAFAHQYYWAPFIVVGDRN